MIDKFNRADLLVSFFFFLSSFVFSFLSLSHIRLMKLSLVGKGPTLKSLRIAKMSLHKCNQTLLCWRIKVSSRFTNGVKLWYIFWYSMLSYYTELSTEAEAGGVLGQKLVWHVELDCRHVKGKCNSPKPRNDGVPCNKAERMQQRFCREATCGGLPNLTRLIINSRI